MERFSLVRKLSKISAVVITASFVFAGCTDNSPIDPLSSSSQPKTLEKRLLSNASSISDADVNAYPQYGSVTLNYFEAKRQYRGGSFDLPNGSTFWVTGGALTPPPGHPVGEPVTITMKCDKDPNTGELVFKFGPSGSKFDPSAVVEFSYRDLGVDKVDFFYIDENNNYVPQTPDHINAKGQTLELRIDHFSRYAIAHSR